jgi:hypothetical protein
MILSSQDLPGKMASSNQKVRFSGSFSPMAGPLF